jgi:hypothetical protein
LSTASEAASSSYSSPSSPRKTAARVGIAPELRLEARRPRRLASGPRPPPAPQPSDASRWAQTPQASSAWALSPPGSVGSAHFRSALLWGGAAPVFGGKFINVRPSEARGRVCAAVCRLRLGSARGLCLPIGCTGRAQS